MNLAINNGQKVLKEPLPETNNIDQNEYKAVLRVLKSGTLSGFIARAGDHFLGGPEVKALENYFTNKFNVEHAVAFNSATTALDAAVCALELGPGDEIIVPSTTMSATATAILMNMVTPIFADIEKDTFCLDPKSVEKNITERTKAIMVVNLFGGAARMDKIMDIARTYDLKVIEDNAQSPGGTFNRKYLGTIGDIGIFSFNQHKTVHCGEGGMLITNREKLAYRAQLKRNHGECISDDYNTNDFIVGNNYRMTEMEAAIASEQMKKLGYLNEQRIMLANYLTRRLGQIGGITPPKVLPDSDHVYFVYPFKFNEKMYGVKRDWFADAMAAEGFPLGKGYVKPIYLMTLFQGKQIFPNSDFPFNLTKPNYAPGICPNAESLWKNELLVTNICRYPLKRRHIDKFVCAIRKILRNRRSG